MHTKSIKRAAALATAVAAVASVSAFTGVASAAPSTGALALGPAITPVTSSGTSFNVTYPASPNNACQGDSSSGGYRVNTFMVPASVDASTLTYNASGVVAPTPTTFASPLYNGSNVAIVNINTAPVTGVVINAGTFNFTNLQFLAGGVPDGDYKIGVACTLAGVTTRLWEKEITIAASPGAGPVNFRFGTPAAPAAPAGLTAVAGDGQITGQFNAVTAALPAVTGYTVTATPTVGAPVTVSVAPSASPITYTIPGLTNGTSYSVTVTATNGSGTSAPSTAVNPVTPAFSLVTPAPVVVADNGPSPVIVSWTPSTGTPSGGATLVSHTVTFTPVGTAAAIAPVTVAAGTNQTSVTGVVGDFYTVSVVGNYSNGQTTAAGVDSFGFVSSRVIVQDIQVTRPEGALVLTQRCGVYGSAIAYSDDVFGSLPLLPATAGADPDMPGATASPTDDYYSTLPGGSAPKNDSLPFNPNAGVTTDDTLFPQYPYPIDANGDSIATYPTNCGITLDQPRLITSGPRAGQYFRTTGRIAQLTVVNTQNIDGGWTLNGTMGNFSNGTDSFSGNLMGWDPEVTWDSLANLDGYDMTAVAGGRRQPEATASTTGLGAAFNATNTALASSLAKAEVADSLGMAVVDARLRLLIPVAADSGIYRGALTFTIV